MVIADISHLLEYKDVAFICQTHKQVLRCFAT